MTAVLAGLTLYCIAIGLVQLAFLLGLGGAEGRRQRRGDDPTAVPWMSAAVFALVPCLDEAAVIGPTVAALAAQHPAMRVLVIDDASSDGTGDVARAVGDVRI